MKEDMENVWSRFLSETAFAKTFTEQWLPSVEISESKGMFSIKTDLIDLEPRHVNVNLSFTVNGGKIEVTFKKGVLNSRFPKLDETGERISRDGPCKLMIRSKNT